MAISLSALAKAGFFQLEQSAKNFAEIAVSANITEDELLTELSKAAEPDQVLSGLLTLKQVSMETFQVVLSSEHITEVVKLFGASI